MDSFLLSNYYSIYKGVEVFAALVGVLQFRKYKKDKAARCFIYFLIYIQIIETLGAYPSYIHKFESLNWLKNALNNTIFIRNYWWYTLFWTIGSSIFFGYYFHLIIESKKLKFLIKWTTLFCIVLSFFLFCVNSKVFNYNYLVSLDIINFLLILFLVFIYLIEVLNSEKILNSYKTLPFYVTLGIFAFWIITTPLTFFEEYYNTSDKGYIILKQTIKLLAITFTYLTFAIGLIVSKPEKKT